MSVEILIYIHFHLYIYFLFKNYIKLLKGNMKAASFTVFI